MQEQRGYTSVRQYRGKRLDNGEWVYGSLISDRFIVGDVLEWNDEYFNTEWWLAVDPSTVSQYTGLKDRNDKWIYEGDIVERKVKSINYSDSFNVAYCEVFRNVQGAYRIKGKGIYETELYSERKNVEVIGNIHDNPELLEVPHE